LFCFWIQYHQQDPPRHNYSIFQHINHPYNHHHIDNLVVVPNYKEFFCCKLFFSFIINFVHIQYISMVSYFWIQYLQLQHLHNLKLFLELNHLSHHHHKWNHLFYHGCMEFFVYSFIFDLMINLVHIQYISMVSYFWIQYLQLQHLHNLKLFLELSLLSHHHHKWNHLFYHGCMEFFVYNFIFKFWLLM
jgi:hypothetical protein